MQRAQISQELVNEKINRLIREEIDRKTKEQNEQQIRYQTMCNTVHDNFRKLMTGENNFVELYDDYNYIFKDFETCDSYKQLSNDLKKSNINLQYHSNFIKSDMLGVINAIFYVKNDNDKYKPIIELSRKPYTKN